MTSVYALMEDDKSFYRRSPRRGSLILVQSAVEDHRGKSWTVLR